MTFLYLFFVSKSNHLQPVSLRRRKKKRLINSSNVKKMCGVSCDLCFWFDFDRTCRVSSSSKWSRHSFVLVSRVKQTKKRREIKPAKNNIFEMAFEPESDIGWLNNFPTNFNFKLDKRAVRKRKKKHARLWCFSH